MIYFMPICEADQMETQYRSWLPQLPSARQKKLLRYRFAKDRWLCAAAYMLLLHGLQNEYGIAKEQVKMEVEEFGKPYLASHPHIFFNLSHCDLGVVCGLSDAPIGIDIESIRKITPRVVKRVLNDAEQEIMTRSRNPELTFTSMWTLKESLIKAIGCGFQRSISEATVSLSVDGDLYIQQDGYRAYVLVQEGLYCISVCSNRVSNTHYFVRKISLTQLVIW